MAKRNSHTSGREAFLTYYRALFSTETEFEKFLGALQTPTRPILRFNPKNESRLRELWSQHHLPWQTLDWYPYALLWPESIPLGTTLPGNDEHLFYVQNASSLLPVLALDPKSGETILDACAAPGGKTLFIAERMQSAIHEAHNTQDEKPLGTLIANDLSLTRRERMKKLFREHDVDSFIHVSGSNAATLFKKFPAHFDRILLDAPCSSEKHVYNSPKHLAEWKPGRIRNLKIQQLSLINGLFLALKPGGRLVYSTCAITPEENEQVIEKFFAKYNNRAKYLDLPNFFNTSKKSQVQPYFHLLPHQHPDMDPMFVAAIQKIT